MRALDRKLLRDTSHLKAQLIAVTLVVACGIAMWVTLKTAHASLVLSQEIYYRQYRFADVFAGMRRAPLSLVARIQAIPGVVSVQHRIAREITLDVPGLAEPGTARAVSIPEIRRPLLNDLVLRSGRWIAPNHPDEVILSEAFAKANRLSIGDSIGAVLNGRRRELLIVGTALSPEFIYEIRPGTLFPDKKRFGVLWMSREALEAAFDMEGAFNDLALTLAHGANEQDVIDRVDDRIAPWGGAGAYGRDEQVSNRFISDEIRSLEISAAFTPAIFLGVAAFLIHLVLSRLVQLQRDQIAILKAFGYESRTVGVHYLEMALLTVGAGAILGIGAGLWLGRQMTGIYAELYNLPLLRFEAPAAIFASSVSISALAAAAGALSSVGRAISLPPAEAMRPEAPPDFHAGLIEKIPWKQKLSPATRIIIRNILRRKTKSILAILGVAMAVAILVIGRFNADGIQHLIHVQFGLLQREDVTVSFVVTRGIDAALELSSLPGVLAVEPYRAVPVRLRHEHRSRRTGLIGMPENPSLRRLIDERAQPYALPSEGVVLTNHLAKMLAVEPGDMLTIEVLDESRPTVRVPLAATVDELIGVSAYMRLDALNRMMHEGRSISGAYLLVDGSRSDELYARLKNTPGVAGVASRDVMLQSFLDTIGEMMSVINAFVITFAVIIAMGVVYNGARIALSERGRELASLRVLGFTRTEVGAMLLGEQTILTAIAVPFGFVIGYLLSAWLASKFQTDLYRFPVVITNQTWALAFLVVAIAAVISGFLVQRRIRHLDLVEVLKTRE